MEDPSKIPVKYLKRKVYAYFQVRMRVRTFVFLYVVIFYVFKKNVNARAFEYINSKQITKRTPVEFFSTLSALQNTFFSKS